jgi:hypothetical protein
MARIAEEKYSTSDFKNFPKESTFEYFEIC